MNLNMVGRTQFANQVKRKAAEFGFNLVGIAPAKPSEHIGYYRAWLAEGCHAGMTYLARETAIERRADLSGTVPNAKTVLSVGANYFSQHLPDKIKNDPSRGVIAAYAWSGLDYHDLLTPRLRHLQAWLTAQLPGQVQGRSYVDTGPILERELAVRAGLGFIGKNTCLIHPEQGSYFFMGEIIIDYELPFDSPLGGTCGACTRCLTACPTDALTPYRLDSNVCISYLTIENKGAIPTALRPKIGNRIFGCDICQEVCPYNRQFSLPTDDPDFNIKLAHMAPALIDLMTLDDDGFRTRFKGSPIKRSKRRGLLRNVAVALGNWGNPQAIPVLTAALRDPEPLIREHAAWALHRIHQNNPQTT